MRIKHIALFAAAATVSLSSFAEQQGAADPVVQVRSSLQQVPMPAFLFDRVQGDYALEDGRVLQVSSKREPGKRTLYADLGQGKVELIHVGKKRYVAVGQDLSLRFQGDKIPDTVFVRDGGNRVVAAAAQR